MRDVIKPAWLATGVEAVLERLSDQFHALYQEPSTSERMGRVAALWEREARCWRVLARHTEVRVCRLSMFAAAARATEAARQYHGHARFYREQEARKVAAGQAVA
jgi:hypothetical protein